MRTSLGARMQEAGGAVMPLNERRARPMIMAGAALGAILAGAGTAAVGSAPALVAESLRAFAEAIELPSAQAGRLDESQSFMSAPVFRADAWFLPDEPLLGFVKVEAGSFMMGSAVRADPFAFDNEYWIDAASPRSVELPDYYLGRYEVTVAQYRSFVESSGFRANEQALAAPDNHPVTYVSWPDALAYARWLEGRLKEWPRLAAELAKLFREGWHITLPTEAQWEKGARGVDGRRYPWGDEPRTERANVRSGAASAVGSIICPECPYGLADMSGNVWEWTRTPFRPGPYRRVEPPLDLESDALWVIRGGSFADDLRAARAATRGGADPGARRPFIGFRLVLTRA